MRIAPLGDVKARLIAYVDECGAEGPLVITRNGKPVAVLVVPYEEDDLERVMLGLAAFSGLAQSLQAKHQAGQRLVGEVVLGRGSETGGPRWWSDQTFTLTCFVGGHWRQRAAGGSG